MRLIDADKLKQNLNGNIAPYWIYPSVTKMIDEQPTIDAVPVVHGYWKNNNRCISCSECGNNGIETDFCPHCGAKMNEGGEEE